MKKQYIFFVSLAGLLCLNSSCTDNQKKESSKKTEVVSEEKESEEEKLHLNEGKKWIVNPETADGVQNMVSIVGNFESGGAKSAYVQLFDTLDTEFRLIFKNCTMEGKGHDQLHLYLLPLRGAFNRLKSDEAKIRDEAVASIREQLGLFPQYFVSE